MRQYGAMAGQEGALAGMGYKDAQNTRNMFAGFGQAAGYGVADDEDDKKKGG